MMEEYKRSPVTASFSNPKRHKVDQSNCSKGRKEKVGDKITALQHIVSPYGKTDTASVLWEAMEYIKFLQEQVKVLSGPYLQRSTLVEEEPEEEEEEEEAAAAAAAKNNNNSSRRLTRLRSKGLCVVPISWMTSLVGGGGVTTTSSNNNNNNNNNGADIWAPIHTPHKFA